MEVTNPDKPMFPADGITKADVVRHYERVAEAMMRFIAGRPLTLQRFPAGIAGKGFMQKNAQKHFPAAIERFEVPKRDGDVTRYPVIHDAESLAYLANQGTVTFHMWTSRATEPDHPDWLVLDLDPDADDLDGVRRATRAVRAVLDDFDLVGFPLATGSSGFHVWVPLDGSSTMSDAALVTRALAGLVVARDPERFTVEFLKKKRRGRVFVDWLRNTATATVVAPFSLRPLAGAPVAVPLRWDELDSVVPGRWTLRDLGDRLSVDTTLTPQAVPVEAVVAAARAQHIDLDTPFDRFGRR